MDFELSQKFEVKDEVRQRSVLSCFRFALLVDAVKVFARYGALCYLLYADDLFLINETIDGLRISS